MGTIGRYIDALPDEARGRIIEAQGWRDEVYVDRHGDRCLLGHTEDWRVGEDVPRHMALASLPGGSAMSGICVGDFFDQACARFGLARVVRACKLRAGRPNRITLPASVPAAKEASDAA